MNSEVEFSLEVVDGDRLGKITVPFSQIANWLNLLTSPHYDVQIVYTEQGNNQVSIYFDACEALYWYLSDRVSSNFKAYSFENTHLSVAS